MSVIFLTATPSVNAEKFEGLIQKFRWNIIATRLALPGSSFVTGTFEQYKTRQVFNDQKHNIQLQSRNAKKTMAIIRIASSINKCQTMFFQQRKTIPIQARQIIDGSLENAEL